MRFYYFLLAILFVNFSNCCAQDIEQSTKGNFISTDYPQGLYLTFEDFTDKNAINIGEFLTRKPVVGFKQIDKNQVVDQVFFFNAKNNSKITNAFAISYNGSIYFQQRYIQKMSSKEDRNQEGDNPNSYHRVTKDGKFFYLEGAFANGWSKAFAYGSGGAVGGTLGSSLNRLKGVVFDMEKKEFNYIRECIDLNALLEKYKSDKVDCEDKKKIDILFVREVIDRIIK